MLKPKHTIGIIYGHKKKYLEQARKIIDKYEKEGYRVTSQAIDSDELSKSKFETIYQTFKTRFKDISAALIFMTPDDYGISVKEWNNLFDKWKDSFEGNKEASIGELKKELENKFQFRARQNVLLELGYVLHTVGEGKYRIFAKKGEIEIPTDLEGKFFISLVEDDISELEQQISTLIKENLKLEPSNILQDEKYKINYRNLIEDNSGQKISVNKKLLDFFDEEYKCLNEVEYS